MHRIWRYFQWLGRPLLRHGVFVLFMVILMWTTYSFVGEPRTKHLDFYVMQFLMDLYVFCGMLCLMERWGRKRRGWRIAARTAKYTFYAISYVVCFVEAFIYMRFFLAFSPTMLNLAMETNGGESSEFIRSCLQSPKFMEAVRIYGTILAANIACGLWGHRCYELLCRWMLRRGAGSTLRRMTGRFIRSMLFPTMAAALLGTTGIAWMGEKWKMIDYMLISETTDAEKITSNVFYSPFLRIVYSAKFVQVVHKDTQRLVARMRENTLIIDPATVADTLAADSAHTKREAIPTIVLVIGESYNKHHASCYGYPLPTTPNMDRMIRQGEMIVYSDAVSPWNITSNAFKAFLSTHSTDEEGSWTNGVLFPAIFRKAGYRVSLITNQFYRSKRQNRSDFNGSFFLNDPQLDSLCFDVRNARHFRYDYDLLQELDRNRTTGPNLYMVHFMGQHVLYKERCPEKERLFTADDYDRPELTEDERQIIADYDNATRYNDYVVSKVIDRFRREDAVVIYFADHGDEVFDGTIGMFGRNHTADLSPEVLRGEFEVPMLMWTSRKFRRSHPDLLRTMREAANLPFATDDMPHLLMGLAAINSPYYKAQRDLLSPTFNPNRKRPIKDIANYDDIIKK